MFTGKAVGTEINNTNNSAVWQRKAVALQSIELTGGPVPATLFGPGCSYTFVSDLVEINGDDRVARTE